MSGSPAKLRVLGIAGSLRAGSHNRALLRAAGALAPAGMEITILEGLREIPPYDADEDGAGEPAPVAALRRAIRDADALLIATPEYNYGVPGVLKKTFGCGGRRRPAAESFGPEGSAAIRARNFRRPLAKRGLRATAGNDVGIAFLPVC